MTCTKRFSTRKDGGAHSPLLITDSPRLALPRTIMNRETSGRFITTMETALLIIWRFMLQDIEPLTSWIPPETLDRTLQALRSESYSGSSFQGIR